MSKAEKIIRTIGVLLLIIFGPKICILILEEITQVKFVETNEFAYYALGFFILLLFLLTGLVLFLIFTLWWDWIRKND